MEIELFKGANAFNAELSVDPDTGEIKDENLEFLVSRNPIGTCAFILNSNANLKMIEDHIKLLQLKAKSIKNNVDRAKEALKYAMQQSAVHKVESIDKTFKAVLYPERDCSVNVYDEYLLDNEFLTFIPASYSPNKTLIKKSLQDGKEIQGANLVYNDRLTIS